MANPPSANLTPSLNQSLFHFNTAGSRLLHTGPCTFAGFSVNTGAASSSLSVYDGLTAGGALLGVFDTAVTDERPWVTPGGGWGLLVGCFIVVVGTPDITIVLQ
jgi:hypothetical protein